MQTWKFENPSRIVFGTTSPLANRRGYPYFAIVLKTYRTYQSAFSPP